MAKISKNADKTLTYITKITVDRLEAIRCQDGICAVISGIGVCANSLSIATSFISGPNRKITTVVKVPV